MYKVFKVHAQPSRGYTDSSIARLIQVWRDAVLAARRGGVILIIIAGAAILTAGCQPQPKQVFIEVDGGRQALTTEAATVRQALTEARITLGPMDRVTPDLYVELEPGMVIQVTRVREEIEVQREVVPFERQVITNEALAPNETRLVQLGVNGEDEITIRVVYENDVEVSRTEVSRQTVIEPVPEILVVGAKGNIPSTPIDGAIAYLDTGNAWIMRDSSGSRRPLTTDGNLDSRVFSLSPDGRWLIYTTGLADDIEQPLNELWLASTTIVGEEPITLGIRGVLQAEWSPVVTQSLVAYTTAERVASPPGWKARNDLWLLDLPLAGNESGKASLSDLQTGKASGPTPVQVLPPGTPGVYAWWGTTFKWSPQGDRLAYARADQIGVVNITTTKIITASITPLLNFTPFDTFSEWVWTPHLSWSPDGQFIAATIHGPPLASEPAEQSQVFDLWLLSADGQLAAKVVEQVGMWANPAWGPSGIAFGQAVNPLQSVNSRYSIQLIDRDGSNKRQLFPFRSEPGVSFPELVWSPSGDDLLFVYNGNLYLTTSRGGPPRQLTIGSQITEPRWAAHAPVVSYTIELSQTGNISSSTFLTSGGTITATPDASTATPKPAPTPSPTVSRKVTPSPTLTRTPTLSPAPTVPVVTPSITVTATGIISLVPYPQ